MSYPPLRNPDTLVREFNGTKPRIVCISGSMRFFQQMLEVAANETAEGRIMLAPFVTVQPDEQNTAAKRQLDELHLRKIDLADEVIVVNPGGYIGQSTAREIAYAQREGKPIRWLVPPETAASAVVEEDLTPGDVYQTPEGREWTVVEPVPGMLRLQHTDGTSIDQAPFRQVAARYGTPKLVRHAPEGGAR